MSHENQTVWTPDRDRRLMKAIVDGDSYLTIARSMRVSRNAIAGRVFRLRKRGFSFDGPGHEIQTQRGNASRAYRPSRKHKTDDPTPARKEGDMTKSKAVAAAAEKRVRDVTTGRLAPERGNKIVRLEGSPEPITILELQPGQCKAAVGAEPPKGFGVTQPFVFCSAPAEEGEPYCIEHGRLMYQRPKHRVPGNGGRGMILERLGISKGA